MHDSLTTLEQRCSFQTERLLVHKARNFFDPKKPEAFEQIVELLSPEVTKYLPPGWQEINSESKALEWIEERYSESTVLVVTMEKMELVGLIFLFEDGSSGQNEIRFGYLLNKKFWGKGIGTEVLKGFVDWCKVDGQIASISGGVEKGNIGSIKVLEKVGFNEVEVTDGPPDTQFYTYRFK